MLSEFAECCLSSQSCVRAHGMLSELTLLQGVIGLTECSQSSRNVGRAYGVLDMGVGAHGVPSELMTCPCSLNAVIDD